MSGYRKAFCLLLNELHGIKQTLQECCNIIQNKECQCINTCNCTCEGGGNGGGGSSALCISNSVSNEGNGFADVIIPANSCITKIYASFIDNIGSNRYAQVTILDNALINVLFNQRFVESSSSLGEFDTTLVQPLCVGPTQAIGRVIPESQTAAVTMTVIYCQDCCPPPPPEV